MKIILSILLVLIIPIFGISSDGYNESIPKNSVTFKDRLGVDTGMTEEKLEMFREEYAQKFKQLFPHFRSTAYKSYFEKKINLNKIEIFEEYGLDLRKFSVIEGSSYQKNTLHSDIVATGQVVEIFEANTNQPKYKFEINQILKGSEVIKYKLGDIPKFLNFTDFHNVSVLNVKGIYFFDVDPIAIDNSLFVKIGYSTVITYNESLVCYERDRNRFDSAFKYKHGKLELSKMQKDNNYGERYLNWYEECYIGSWDEVIENIIKIIEVNDRMNFYKNTWK